MREMAEWFARAVSVVEGWGDGEAEMLLQSGVTSLEDLAACNDALLPSIGAIDEAGIAAVRARAGELAVEKAEEDARLAAEAEARAQAEAEALEAQAAAERAARAAAAAEAEAAEAAEADAASSEGTES